MKRLRFSITSALLESVQYVHNLKILSAPQTHISITDFLLDVLTSDLWLPFTHPLLFNLRRFCCPAFASQITKFFCPTLKSL